MGINYIGLINRPTSCPQLQRCACVTSSLSASPLTVERQIVIAWVPVGLHSPPQPSTRFHIAANSPFCFLLFSFIFFCAQCMTIRSLTNKVFAGMKELIDASMVKKVLYFGWLQMPTCCRTKPMQHRVVLLISSTTQPPSFLTLFSFFSKVKAIFQWDINCGGTVKQWTVDLKNGSGELYEGTYLHSLVIGAVSVFVQSADY